MPSVSLYQVSWDILSSVNILMAPRKHSRMKVVVNCYYFCLAFVACQYFFLVSLFVHFLCTVCEKNPRSKKYLLFYCVIHDIIILRHFPPMILTLSSRSENKVYLFCKVEAIN